MKRLLLLLVIAAAVALGIYYFTARKKSAASASGVASLLPADTVLLIHIPDVEKNRKAWKRTDLYHLYHEPAVEDFLRKPRLQLSKSGVVGEAWRDSSSLRMRDVFVATNTVDALRLIGGFEFRCGEKEARAVIDRWMNRWQAQNGQRGSSNYGSHAIDIFSTARGDFASSMVGHRFLFASSMEDLKALLDRVDDHDKSARLTADENFRSAMRQMPTDYAGLLYVQPKSFARKLVALRAQSRRSLPPGQETSIERMQSFSHAMVFEGGKLRDIDFVAMPRLVDTQLSRETLAAASNDTLLYLALILNLQEVAAGMAGQESPLSKAGVPIEDVKAAFGDEMSLLGDWPSAARMPGAVATLAVRDASKARSIARALASSANWQSSPRGDVEYFTAPPSGIAVMRLMAAISDNRLAIGLDSASVERAISPSAEASKLESAPAFEDASRLVPEPQQMFVWLNLPAFYARLDASLRPLLQLSAAFMPEASGRFDVNKLPAAEVVTRHLSPVVASQSYVDGGYRSESVGTITLGQTAILGFGGYVGWQIFQKHGDVMSGWGIKPVPTSNPTP